MTTLYGCRTPYPKDYDDEYADKDWFSLNDIAELKKMMKEILERLDKLERKQEKKKNKRKERILG